jgi:hypothetical protein
MSPTGQLRTFGTGAWVSKHSLVRYQMLCRNLLI